MHTVTQLFRYPVKSMAGEAMDCVNVGPSGILGDRAWAVKDEERGGIRGGKRFPELMQCRAQFAHEPSAERPSAPVDITRPDGTRVSSGDDRVNSALSEVVGSTVSLWPLLPAEQLDHYRRGESEMISDPEGYLRAMFGRTADEPLPDLSQFPEELFEYESPPGTYFDAYPLLLLSTNTLETLAGKAPESRFDQRRFRTNILFESDESGFVENAWAGGRVRIGTVELTLEIICPRCVMTTHGFDDLPKDPKIMRTLVRENGGNAGVYASVSQPGEIRVGDTIELL